MKPTDDFDAQLQRHLWKAELAFRAKHQQQSCCIKWLAPHCGSAQELLRFLRSLGYRNLRQASDVNRDGHVEWVETDRFSILVSNEQEMQGLFIPFR